MGHNRYGRNDFTHPPFDKAHNERLRERRITDPWTVGNYGIPIGSTKQAAAPLWRAAHGLADKYLDYMKKTEQAPSDMAVRVVERPNTLPHTEMVVPVSDEEKAVVALREAFLLAVGPTAIPEKIKAINTVLAYTRAKPESATKLRVEKAEDFLDLIAEVRATDDDAATDSDT